jgi:chromosome segregation ATPase
VEDLPGLQLWEIVSGLNRRLNDMSAELNNVESRLTQEQAKSVAAAISVTKLTQDVRKALADASFARGLATGHSAKVVDLELKIQSLEVRLVVAESDSSDAKALGWDLARRVLHC